jgi:excisionase family DNA binding protein
MTQAITVTVDEAARMLGVNRKSLYTAIARGEVPGVVRIGRAVRIGRDAILRWAGCCPPPADSENR